MKIVESSIFKYLICPLIFFLSALWGLVTFRALGGLLLVALLCSYVCFLLHGRVFWMRLMWVAFIISTLLPVDISFRNYPGPPRLIPYFSGTPTAEALGKVKRGEMMWSGSCGGGDLEPEYVLVW